MSSYNTAGLISEVPNEVATQVTKNCLRQKPHSHLMPRQEELPANIRIHLIFPETRALACIFSLIVWVYLHSNLGSGPQKTHLFCNRVCFGRSRSSKVDDFGTNQKRICDFLLVRHCDWSYLLLFLMSGDLLAKNCLFSYPISFGALAPYVPFGISHWT